MDDSHDKSRGRFGAVPKLVWKNADVAIRMDMRDELPVFAISPASYPPSPNIINRLVREYSLRDEIDESWALRPLELRRSHGSTTIILKQHDGQLLANLVGRPIEITQFLELATSIAAALRKAHDSGFIHKDIKPANVVVNCNDGVARLTGLGLATRLSRERQMLEIPETIAGTLAYMAPEQTGRTNRSIDNRSDLYALGITFYQMLTGSLPFSATEAIGWVHAHIARMPIPPAMVRADIPNAISAIVVKLLSKAPEDRYQTAAGLERDLRRCQMQWQVRNSIDEFDVGQDDHSDKLTRSERLYGRKIDVQVLTSCFERVCMRGTPELLLISGYSGIGKSSIVSELHKVLVTPRALFASAKFEQIERDVPYATLLRAFQDLVRSLLSKTEAGIKEWRVALLDALGANARLIADIIPELTLIVGKQPRPPDLPPQQAQVRFQLTFRRFMSVFARAEHPLVFFLDDLQWLDIATLDLLEDLLTRPDLNHVLVVGAYRSNEVNADHPLARRLERIKISRGDTVSEIVLKPLEYEHVVQMVADTLRSEAEEIAPLARLIFEKTGGNPFFIIQFVFLIHDENLLVFDREQARWIWYIDLIRNLEHTDNVVELMIGKLARLPKETQNALRQMACLGRVAERGMLSIVVDLPPDELHRIMWPARQHDLVETNHGAYRFSHDRIQEAAYSSIPTDARREIHYRLGRLLLSRMQNESTSDAIFSVVNQLNRSAELICLFDERDQLARLNLDAGKRAKLAAAYSTALEYFTAGEALLPVATDDGPYTKLSFDFNLYRAECEFLTGSPALADKRLAALQRRARSFCDLSAIARLRGEISVSLGPIGRGVEVGLQFLKHAGIEWTAHPDFSEVQAEYARLRAVIGDRSVQSLHAEAVTASTEVSATIEVLLQVAPAALPTDENLFCLTVCRMANLSFERGISDGSCLAYVWLGLVLGPYLGDYQLASEFAQLGMRLIDSSCLDRFKARAYMLIGAHVVPWTQHMELGRPLIQQAFDVAKETGDITFAGFSCCNLISNMLAAGDTLAHVEREALAGLRFVQSLDYQFVIGLVAPQLQLVRTLRGRTPQFGELNDESFDEATFETTFMDDPIATCWYWIRILQARFSAGNFLAALDAATKAAPLIWTSRSCLEVAEYHFYSALTRARLIDDCSGRVRQAHIIAIEDNAKSLTEFARNSSESFGCHAALVAAEIARVQDRILDAMHGYERAIELARSSRQVQVEALAHELAGLFYKQRRLEKIAQIYLTDARQSYAEWGADGKVQHLNKIHFDSDDSSEPPSTTFTEISSSDSLDLTTVIKISKAISSELEHNKLIDALMRITLEQAGAETAALLLIDSEEHRLIADAFTGIQGVTVRLRNERDPQYAVPLSLVRYVARTGECVVLDDALIDHAFSNDPYFAERRIRSFLAIPLTSQTKPIGVLYLENNLATRVFRKDKLAILTLIASQAAISLENVRLYRDIEERESKIRRLVDADVIGIVIWDLDGRVLEANDAFLRMLQYDRTDLAAGLRWFDMTPPDWQDVYIHQEAEELRTTGKMQPREKEYFRKDRTRVPVLIGAAAFESQPDQGVAYILDLTDLKRAEEQARDNEERYRQVQMQLAHANRISAMNQLTGAIAHEVNQPITATVINAQAALRGLVGPTTDLVDVRKILESIARDGTRAGDIIARIRQFVIKAPPSRVVIEINAPIREVIALARTEANKHCVVIRSELADHLPSIKGDRVQLQQVVLNLLFNAFDAMSGSSIDRREVFIQTADDGLGNIVVTVKDSGPGFSAASGKDPFEAFFSTKDGGLGMGLSICQSIVEEHGGRIWMESQHSTGAIFRFSLPAVVERPFSE